MLLRAAEAVLAVLELRLPVSKEGTAEPVDQVRSPERRLPMPAEAVGASTETKTSLQIVRRVQPARGRPVVATADRMETAHSQPSMAVMPLQTRALVAGAGQTPHRKLSAAISAATVARGS